MIDIAQYICVEDLIAEKPATALGEITSLGLGGKLDFFIVLENVYVIWLAVFGDHKDCCGYHRTSGREFFKITTEFLEKLVVASKGRQVHRVVQLDLEVPVEVKEEYGLEPDYYTFELRRLPRPGTLNTTSTIDIPVNQPSSNRDIFNKLDTVWTPGDIFEERDYAGWANSELDNAGWENFELGNAGWKIKVVSNLYWEKIEENDLVSLMERNILQLWVVRDQAKRYFKETIESGMSDMTPASDGQLENSYSDFKVIGREKLNILQRDNAPAGNSEKKDDKKHDLVVAVGWKKKGKNKNGLMSIEDATGMSEGTVRKYADIVEPDFLKNRVRKTSIGKEAIHLTQIDVNKIIAAKKNF